MWRAFRRFGRRRRGPCLRVDVLIDGLRLRWLIRVSFPNNVYTGGVLGHLMTTKLHTLNGCYSPLLSSDLRLSQPAWLVVASSMSFSSNWYRCRVLVVVKKDPEARPGPGRGSGNPGLFWFRVGVAHILQKNVTHSAAVCVSISRSLIKTYGFEQTNLKKLRKHKMGHRGSKIGFSGINRDGFFMKITFPRSVCVKNITFDRFLKIFVFFKIVKRSFWTGQKIKISIFVDFSIFWQYLMVSHCLVLLS